MDTLTDKISRLSLNNETENAAILKDIHLQTVKDDTTGPYLIQEKLHNKILSFCDESISNLLELDCDTIIKHSKVIGKGISVLCNAAVSDSICVEIVHEPHFLDKLTHILSIDADLRKKISNRVLTPEELEQERLQQQQSIQKLLDSAQKPEDTQTHTSEAPSIDISQLLQLMPKSSNTPPPYVSEIAIYTTSLLKNLSLSQSTKLTIAQHSSLMKQVYFLIIDITAGGWTQYNSLSVCRNLLSSENNKEIISESMCKDANFVNYLVGMASIHRVIRTPQGQLWIHTEAQRVVALLSQQSEDILHRLIGEGAMRCMCNYYEEQSGTLSLKLEAINAIERMSNVMTVKEMDITLHFCQEGKILIDCILTMIQDENSAIALRGYNILCKLVGACNNANFAEMLEKRQVTSVLKEKGMDEDSLISFFKRVKKQNENIQEGWMSSLVNSVKSWMYPNVNK